MDDKTLQQLSKEITRMRPVNMSDIEGIVSAFLSALKDLKKTLEDKMDEHKSEMSEYNDEHKGKMEEMHDCVSEMESELDEMLSESKTYTDEQTKSVLDKYAKIMSEIKDIKDNMPSMPDLSDINSKIEQAYKKFEEIENRKPEEIQPEFIRDQLEAIEVEEEKLKIEAIGFLRKELDELKARIGSISSRGGTTIFGSAKTRFIDDETPTGTINGVNKTFTLAKVPLDSSLKIYKGGARQRVTEDYTISGRTITFITAPVVGEVLLADYRY